MTVFLLRLFVGAVLLIAPTTLTQAGENTRRAAAELAVIEGDLKKFENPQLSNLHQSGLIERINGSLSALDILLRLADQEAAKPPVSYSSELEQLHTDWQMRDIVKMKLSIAGLTARHPLQIAGILGIEPTKPGLTQAINLHEDLCAGCHDDPDLETKRPAYNLFDEARQQSASEFLARMMVGVRGDRITGIDNPLDDARISALYSYYRSGSPD